MSNKDQHMKCFTINNKDRLRHVRQCTALMIVASSMFGSYLRAQDVSSPRTPESKTAGEKTPDTGNPDYVIREGDTVQMSVFNEPELAVSGRVSRDGTLQCPLIGLVRIGGLSQLSASRIIEAAYQKDYLVHPEVNLFVSQFSVQRVTVLGQVQRPGALEIPSEKRLTILQVLGMAGGPTRIANLKKVLVKRHINGRQETIKVDINGMVSGSDKVMFYVKEDDVITVPESLF